ncbi:polysaccharide pyruvyl transferase family protein [Naasia sp. SYSU D00057]|uniref:polysaccharide pyruvyl transferase family protein n=1 Tax=Naasia sp. SYSU D00057 TaxID=2817380 RepID=UPI0027DCEEBF|nr:polysaccharide pyruvyl transferase family protein [Naasia sp. SYSU D00057]
MTQVSIRGVRVVHWNPRRNSLPLLNELPIGPPVGNFGDLLGPAIVARARGARVVLPVVPLLKSRAPRLLSVGSIMHFARDGDTIWGTGVNGKEAPPAHRATSLDVRAVRGPRTRDWLWKHKRIDAPPIYGDPALLFPRLFPEVLRWRDVKRRSLAVVPNLHDIDRYRTHPGFVDPRWRVLTVVRAIAQSEAVVASSLHGVIIAEALGIPAVLLPASQENPLKYEDYVLGTGRDSMPRAGDLARAQALLSSGVESSLEAWKPDPLMNAFPHDLFVASSRPRSQP